MATWRTVVVGLLTAAMADVGSAQSFVLNLPLRSQRAEVSQRIGITDITIVYHRPLVNGRKIWDGLVPYGQVWRVGANINTTITFSDPVAIDGKPLDTGTYGLHIIPNADAWTVIFSKNSTSWGSFTYDSTEDALRVTVKPRAAAMHEALTLEFDQLQPGSAQVELEWERVAVPFTVSVDVHAVMLASLKRQLRTLSRYTWMSWDDAAKYLLGEHFDPDTALVYANRSIDTEDRYDNEMTKSKVLAALNRHDEAVAAQDKALSLGTPLQIHQFARQLLTDTRNAEAFAIFRANAAKHPDRWFVYDGLARMYSAQGKFGDAERAMKMALAAAPASEKSALDGLVTQLKAKQDISK